MADKRTGPGEPGRRGKRAAPTIDLTATEMKPAESESTPEPQQAAPPPQEPPPVGTDLPPADAGAAAGEIRSSGSFFTASTLAAGAAGAVFTVIILFALWLTGLVPIRDAGSTATRARVAALEIELHDLKSRPTAGVDSKTIDALGERVGKIEQTLAKLPPGDASLAERVAAADNAMKALGLALTALNKRSDDAAATASQARARVEAAEKSIGDLRASVQDTARNAGPGMSANELDALQKRLAALEQSVKDARADIAKAPAADMAARRALSAATLRDAAERGAPFSDELKQAQALSGDDRTLAPLAEFAATGVPSAQVLAKELRDLLPALVKLGDAQPSGNFLERLQANAGKLVRIRPVDAPAGDDAAAVLARLEIDAAKADIAVAVADLGKLIDLKMSDTERSAALRWINKANARIAALAAARQFAATSARSLGAR